MLGLIRYRHIFCQVENFRCLISGGWRPGLLTVFHKSSGFGIKAHP
jgi:hypothetical protein